jgi:hypothetical protein
MQTNQKETKSQYSRNFKGNHKKNDTNANPQSGTPVSQQSLHQPKNKKLERVEDD